MGANAISDGVYTYEELEALKQRAGVGTDARDVIRAAAHDAIDELDKAYEHLGVEKELGVKFSGGEIEIVEL